ncbi:MAG: amino acid--tRNA ligase-related protein [Micromonosporaceae bacterium]
MTLDLAHHQASRSNSAQNSRHVVLAGRVVAQYGREDLQVVTLRDGSGDGLQTDLTVLIDPATLDEGWSPDRWRHEVNPGDHVSVRGLLAASSQDASILHANTWQVLSKSTRTFPDPHDAQGPPQGLLDDNARTLLVRRADILASLRRTLEEQDFIEVETPTLETAAHDAEDRPFQTGCQSVEAPLYLRTSAEFYLKRLIAAGFDQVFELARSFRDERPDATHNVEYTLLEAYRAYDDYIGMRRLTRDLIRTAARAALGTTTVAGPRGQRIELDDDWPVIPFYTAVSNAVGEQITAARAPATARVLARQHGLPNAAHTSAEHVAMHLYERLVEPQTIRPTFYIDFPRLFSPLARAHPTHVRLAQKWDLVIFGREIAAAYSEMVDAHEQLRLLRNQDPGSPEDLKPIDREFLDTLEAGMPPTGGLVVGVDRLVMTLTGATEIRQVVPFPLDIPT